jgi:dipeptidyl-peptidase-4
MAQRYVSSLSASLRALSFAAGLSMGLGVTGAPGMAQTTIQDKPVPMVPAPPLSKTNRVLTLERLYDGPDLSGPRATGVQLSPDGSILTFLKPIQGQSSLSLWAMPSGGGEPYVLLDAGALNDSNKVMSEAEKAMRERMRISASGIISYSWSSDSKAILVPLDGDIFRVDPLTKVFDRLTETKGDEIDARLSADGKSLAYVRDGALYTLDLATKSEVRISPEATDIKHYGAAEFIAQEELARFNGFWISPQSDRIAYQSTDESGVEIAERVEVGGSGITTIRQRYPFAGQQNAVVKLFVSDLKGGTEPIEIDLGSNVDIYLARVHWSKDGKALFVQRLSRDQKTLELLKYDPVSGKGQVLIRDTDAHFIELSDDFRELKDGCLIWSSEGDIDAGRGPRAALVIPPPRISFDAQGNVLMAEWNKWGRVLRWNLRK